MVNLKYMKMYGKIYVVLGDDVNKLKRTCVDGS